MISTIVNVRDQVNELQQFGRVRRVVHAAHVEEVIESLNKELDDAARIFSASHQHFVTELAIDLLTLILMPGSN
jgi:hypothetical protein